MTTDKFGITQLYKTNTISGREWYSKWNVGGARSWTHSNNDSVDTEFITAGKGDGSFYCDGKGSLFVTQNPRMYVLGGWKNVEITVYGRRIADSNISYGGIMAYARTNHYIDANTCDDRGYGGRFTYDGRVDFEKETAHHLPNGNAQTTAVSYAMAKNKWYGYKYVVYDDVDGNVKLELYIDETDGLNGGNWVKVTEFTDNGSNFGVGKGVCRTGINGLVPQLKLTSSNYRIGSESCDSGNCKPNLSVYFRTDGAGENGLEYKKASIREIGVDNMTYPDMTVTELATYNGKNGKKPYVGIDSFVYDMSQSSSFTTGSGTHYSHLLGTVLTDQLIAKHGITKIFGFPIVANLVSETVYHNVCQNKVCTKITGAGTNECAKVNECCGNDCVTNENNNNNLLIFVGVVILIAGIVYFNS